MKTTISIFLTVIFGLFLSGLNANAQNCVVCNSNTVGDSASAIGAGNISTGLYSLASGFQNVATGMYSLAGGNNSEATDKWAFAYGERAKAKGFRSFAQGMDVTAFGGNSVAIGRYLRTTTSDAMVIGTGYDTSNYLINNIAQSLMIGFNSNEPTFFVGPALGLNTIGNVGIGTRYPTKNLEVNGTFKVNNWSYLNTIVLEDNDIKNIDELQGYDGLKFKGKTQMTDTQMILTEDGNLGIGSLDPGAKLQVNGDIFIDDAFSGLILKSPDGQCWKGTADNSGNFVLENVDCDQLTGKNESPAVSQKTARIFPNPAGSKLYVEIPEGIQQTYVSIYNEQGVLLKSRDMQSGKNSVSLKKMPAGVLIVKVYSGSGKLLSTEKIMHK